MLDFFYFKKYQKRLLHAYAYEAACFVVKL